MHETLLAILLAVSSASPAHQERVHFANEYVRELIQVVQLRADAARTGSTEETGRIADCVKNGTRLQFALEENARKMRTIKLSDEHALSPEIIAGFWEQEVAVYEKLTDMCAIFMQSSKSGVDYNSIKGEAPKLAAKIDDLDQMLFGSSALVCAALESERSNRLILRRQQRDELVTTLDSSLPKIDEKSPGYLTSGAKVLKIFLTKSGHRMADER